MNRFVACIRIMITLPLFLALHGSNLNGVVAFTTTPSSSRPASLTRKFRRRQSASWIQTASPMRTTTCAFSQSPSFTSTSRTQQQKQQDTMKSSSSGTLRNNKNNNTDFTTTMFPQHNNVPQNNKEEEDSSTSFSMGDAPATNQQQQSSPITEGAFALPFSRDVTTILKKPRVEIFVGLMVLLSSLLAALSTIDEIPLVYKEVLLVTEDLITYIFALEFVMRWYSSVGSKETTLTGYLAKPLVGVDILVVILPLLLPLIPYNPTFTGFLNELPLNWLMSNTALINLRLLRILRLQRVLIDPETFQKFLNALGFQKNNVEVVPYQLDLARVLLSIFTLLSVASGLIYTAEHAVNPAFPNYFTALYFGLTTLTTVGFGDITPITPEGKLVVSGSILAGVAIIPAQTASLVEALLAGQQAEREKKKIGDGNKNGDKNNKSNSNNLIVDESMIMMKDTTITNTLQSSSSSNTGSEVLMTQAMESTTRTKKASSNIINGRQPQDGMIDTKTMCDSCGASFHWSSADYCWSCGSKLE